MRSNERTRRLGLAVLSLGVSMIIVDATEIPGLPAIAQEGVPEAVTGSAGQALPALGEEPGSEPVVAAVSDAFASAARATGLVAVLFVTGGFLLSTRLPDIRYKTGDEESAGDVVAS